MNQLEQTLLLVTSLIIVAGTLVVVLLQLFRYRRKD